MRHLPLALLIAAAAAAAARAQQGTLLFTTSGTETSRSGSAGTYLRSLDKYSIQMVTPDILITHSAEKFLSNWSLQTMAGDTDGDGSVTEHPLGGGVDATLVLPWDWDAQTQMRIFPRTSPVTPNSTYISMVNDIGTVISGGVGLRKGDCGRFVRNAAGNGQVEYFITAEQIIDSFGLSTAPPLQAELQPQNINLDAIAVDERGSIYLSLEDDHWVTVYG